MRRTCPARRTARPASSPCVSAAAPRRRGQDRHSDLWLRGPAEVWRLADALVHRQVSHSRRGMTYPGPSGAGDSMLQTGTSLLGRHGRRKRYRRATRSCSRLAKGPAPVAGCPGAVASYTRGGLNRTERSSTERAPARGMVPRRGRRWARCRRTRCTCPACAVVG